MEVENDSKTEIGNISVNVNVNTDADSGSSSESEVEKSGNSESTSKANTTSDIIDDVNGDEEKVIMCHNGNTIEVAQSAVQAHLDHGDTLGPCEDDVDSSESTEIED